MGGSERAEPRSTETRSTDGTRLARSIGGRSAAMPPNAARGEFAVERTRERFYMLGHNHHQHHHNNNTPSSSSHVDHQHQHHPYSYSYPPSTEASVLVVNESVALRHRENDAFATGPSVLTSMDASAAAAATGGGSTPPLVSSWVALKRRKRHPTTFSHRNNRHHQQQQSVPAWLVHRAMKAVVVSPVLVLLVWGTVATLTSWKNRTTRSQPKSAAAAASTTGTPPRTSRYQRQQQQHSPQQQQRRREGHRRPLRQAYDYDEALPVDEMPPQSVQQQQPQAQPHSVLLATSTTSQLEFQPPRQQSQPVMAITSAASSTGAQQFYYYATAPLQQDESQPRKSIPGQQQQQQLYSIVPPKQQQQETDPSLQQQYYYTFPPQQEQQPPPLQQQQQQGVSLPTTTTIQTVPALPRATTAATTTTSVAHQQPLTLSRDNSLPQTIPILAPNTGLVRTDANWHLRHSDQGRNNHHHQHNNNKELVRYFYYDPQAMKHDAATGHWHLPHFVTDAISGRIVSVQALSAVAPLLVQAAAAVPQPLPLQQSQVSQQQQWPVATLHLFNSTMNNGTAYSSNTTIGNYTHDHPTVVNTRQKRQSILNQLWWGDASTASTTTTTASLFHPNNTTAADKSLLVCTVGVMALLVGAVSARRLRHRSIVLSLCVDGATTVDEHDDGTNVNANTNHRAHSYHTFGATAGGGGWKGDLEKFDV